MTVNLSTTVREAVFGLLRSFRITTIFGNPGSTELPMFRSFPNDFRYIVGLQESVVVGMADGYAQATRNAAMVNLHSAVGVGHALGNIFTAYKNRTPLVITAGQQARSILPTEPFLFSMQATEFPKPYVKWSNEPARAQDVPGAIARAYYLAMQPPCGPTFVSIPVDDWDQPTELLLARQVSTALRAAPDLLATVGVALDHAERPAFVVGAGVDRDSAWDLAVELAERHNALVWVSPNSGRCSFPESHPLFAGFLPAGKEAIVRHLAGHDLVLALGAPVFTYHTEGSGPYLPVGTRLFQLIDDPDVASWLPTGTSLVTSLHLGIADLLDRSLPPRRAKPKGRRKPPRAKPGAAITVAYLMQTLAEIRPPHSIIVEEAPTSRSDMQTYLPINRSEGFYTCSSGGLGHGLPAAVGVALGKPVQKVIALIGDGSSMYAIQGLWSAGQLQVPITFIIIRNGRYQALEDFGRHFGLPSEPNCPRSISLPLRQVRGSTAAGLTVLTRWKASYVTHSPRRSRSSSRWWLLDIERPIIKAANLGTGGTAATFGRPLLTAPTQESILSRMLRCTGDVRMGSVSDTTACPRRRLLSP